MLVREHAAAVIDLTCRLLQDRKEAEEAAQDAFVKAFQQLPSFRGEASLLTWVQRIAYHEALDRLRRQRPYTVDIGDAFLPPEDEDFSTGREQRILLMEEAIASLPPEEQTLLQNYYYEGRPLADIAYIMDTNPNTLSQRLCRIRRKIMMIIKQKENEQT